MQRFKNEVTYFFNFCTQNTAAILENQARVDAYRGKSGSVTVNYSCHSPAIINQVRHFKRLIRPMKVCGYPLIRVGANHDGGYLMLDPGYNGVAYSLGIANEVSWDIGMANRGFKVFQYDGSVDAPPVMHPLFAFEKKFIGPADNPDFRSIASLLEMNGHAGRNDLILQMDIEGAEWNVLDTIEQSYLSCFSQIIIELHLPLFELLLLPVRNSILEKLSKTHQVIHTHINNNGNTLNFDGEDFWTVVELTYARRDDYLFETSEERYPLSIDAPCIPQLVDVDAGYLGLI